MALGITLLRTLARRASVYMAKLYDQIPQDEIVGLIAQTVPSVGRQKSQTIHWADAFPFMREWVGDRALQEVFASQIEITLKPYEITYELDRMDLELNGDSALLPLVQSMSQYFADGFAMGRAHQAYEPLRQNSLSYDGQNFFDTDHTHPDSSTFSNVWDLSAQSQDRTATGAPTDLEARRELKSAIRLAQTNRLKRATIRRIDPSPSIAVVVKSTGVYNGYYDLLMNTELSNGQLNDWKGKFALLEDTSPVSGDEKKVDVILTEPGGPRPSIWVPHRNPGAIEVDESKVFSSRKVPFGQDCIYGFAPGFPQCAVRVQE